MCVDQVVGDLDARVPRSDDQDWAGHLSWVAVVGHTELNDRRVDRRGEGRSVGGMQETGGHHDVARFDSATT
jgi:hypothetical protein